MTSDGAEVCDTVLTTKLSITHGDTKGTFVVRQLQNGGITSTFTTVDSVNWAKPSATGTTNALLDIRKEAALDYAVWYHDITLSKPWLVGNLAACVLSVSPTTTEVAYNCRVDTVRC